MRVGPNLFLVSEVSYLPHTSPDHLTLSMYCLSPSQGQDKEGRLELQGVKLLKEQTVKGAGGE